MKFLIIAAVCVFMSACSSGSGSVVGNGLTGSPSRTQIMDTDEGTCGCGGAEHSCSAAGHSCTMNKADGPKAEADCGCGNAEHHKPKGKAKKAK